MGKAWHVEERQHRLLAEDGHGLIGRIRLRQSEKNKRYVPTAKETGY